MVDFRKGSRNSDATAVEGGDSREAVLNNPLQTPEKISEKDRKKTVKDEENQVHVEDGSLADSSIKVKQLGWVEAAFLMFTEYIVIAILSFPSSYSTLGMAGGIIATVVVGLVVLYTSHVLWRYCLAHPESADIIDLSTKLFPASWRRPVYYIVAGMFLLNNLFIMGLHILSGSEALNTLSDHAVCTIVFSVIMLVVMFPISLVRELNQVAVLGAIAAATMFISLLLFVIFVGIEPGPAGWTAGEPITVRAWAAPDVSFYQGVNAWLNIVYTFVGQILIPTYIEDMHSPQDFPKALYVVTAGELILFIVGGAVGYHFIGNEYMTSPAYGSLTSTFAKIVAGFTIPTLLVVGVLYSNVTSRFVFLRIFDSRSKHRLQHTVKGWTVWTIIVLVGWIISFIIAECIPFFGLLLSLMSSLFDWFFGFVLEGLAFFALYKRGDRWSTPMRKVETIANVIIIIAGLFILPAGTYSSVVAINDEFVSGMVSSVFSCADNAP